MDLVYGSLGHLRPLFFRSVAAVCFRSFATAYLLIRSNGPKNHVCHMDAVVSYVFYDIYITRLLKRAPSMRFCEFCYLPPIHSSFLYSNHVVLFSPFPIHQSYKKYTITRLGLYYDYVRSIPLFNRNFLFSER